MGLIVSLALGGIISVVISRYFWWKSETKNRKISQFSDFIELPRENVWRIISDPLHFEKFYPFKADPFNSNIIGVGSSFTITSEHTPLKSKKFVVIWSPISEFAWGDDSINWSYRMLLKDSGEHRTELILQSAAQKNINPFSFLSLSDQKGKDIKGAGYQQLLNLYQGIKIYCEQGVVKNNFIKEQHDSNDTA